MAREYKIVSGDSHVNPQPTMWREYLPERFRDQAPQLEQTDEGDFVTFEGNRTQISLMGAQAGRKFKDYKQAGKLSDMRPGGWDPAERIKDLDIDHMDGEILYGGGPLGTSSLELHLASYGAYNNWLADFCSHAPDRLLGIAYVPLLDVEKAVSDLKHSASRGLRGSVIAAFPPARDANLQGGLALSGDPNRSYADPEFDPFWKTSIELDMPVHMHLGARRGVGGPDKWMINLTNSKFAMAEPISVFIFTGLLAKYPELNLISVESGVGWMSFMIEYMDHLFERHQYWTQSPLKEPPSFYFHRQVRGTFLHDPAGVRERHSIGVKNLLWSSDYPHSETTWPNSLESIKEHFEGVPEDETFRIICQNAVELYKMESN